MNFGSFNHSNMDNLPREILLDILLKVEAENPLPLRGVCRFWKSLITHPHFMIKHIQRSTDSIFDHLRNALRRYHDFKLEYITHNVVRRQENGPFDEETRRVVNAIDEVERIWIMVDWLCEGEMGRDPVEMISGFLNHILLVVVYIKENFDVMRDIMQNVEGRIRCHQRCLEIYGAQG